MATNTVLSATATFLGEHFIPDWLLLKRLYNGHLSIVAVLPSVPEVAVLLIVVTFNCTLCMTKNGTMVAHSYVLTLPLP